MVGPEEIPKDQKQPDLRVVEGGKGKKEEVNPMELLGLLGKKHPPEEDPDGRRHTEISEKF